MREITRLIRKKNAFQIEMQEHIILSQSPLGVLNASDVRFNQGKPLHCWQMVTLKDFHYRFPVFDLEKAELLKVNESIDLNIPDPAIEGVPLHIRLEEYLRGTDYDYENLPKMAKQIRLTTKIAENGIRYNNTNGAKGQCVSDLIIRNIGEMVGVTEEEGDIAYFVTEAGEPIFRSTSIQFGSQFGKHVTIGFQMIVHHSEVAWATKIDITEGNKVVEQSATELKLS